MSSLGMMNGFGLTLHILYKNGVNLPIRSMLSTSKYIFTLLTTFGRPEKLIPENATYNYHVSAVRIRSEHCIGFLKGRWSSLRGLRVAINNEKGIQYASLWIMACINLHMFAVNHENAHNFSRDRFYKDGKKYLKQQKRLERRWRRERHEKAADTERDRDEEEDVCLLEGKLMREELKEKLFHYITMEE